MTAASPLVVYCRTEELVDGPLRYDDALPKPEVGKVAASGELIGE